jgi:spore germination cell wall hydrolase CwlJ-like protein
MSTGDFAQRRRAARRHDAEIEFLARALLAETDGAQLRAIEALAAATLNRLAAARAARPDATLVSVARRDEAFPAGLRSPRAEERPAFDACRRIAARAAAGAPDPTRGAVRWHRAGDAPAWAAGLVPLRHVGDWVFYGPAGA